MLEDSIKLSAGGEVLTFSPSGVAPLVEEFIRRGARGWLRDLQAAIGDALETLPELVNFYRSQEIPVSREDVREAAYLAAVYERIEEVLSWQVSVRVPRFMAAREFSTRQPFVLVGKTRGRAEFESYSYRPVRAPDGRLRSWLVLHEPPLARLLEAYEEGGQPAYIVKGYPRGVFQRGYEQLLVARLAHVYVQLHRALWLNGEKSPVYPTDEAPLNRRLSA